MTKKITFSKDARTKLADGVDKLANAVTATLVGISSAPSLARIIVLGAIPSIVQHGQHFPRELVRSSSTAVSYQSLSPHQRCE